MYGYTYPMYTYPNIYSDNNNSNWIWAILIVLFVIFFLFWGTSGCKKS